MQIALTSAGHLFLSWLLKAVKTSSLSAGHLSHCPYPSSPDCHIPTSPSYPSLQGDFSLFPCFFPFSQPLHPSHTFFPCHISPLTPRPPSPLTLQIHCSCTKMFIGDGTRTFRESCLALHTVLCFWFGHALSVPNSGAGLGLGFQDDIWPFS